MDVGGCSFFEEGESAEKEITKPSRIGGLNVAVRSTKSKETLKEMLITFNDCCLYFQYKVAEAHKYFPTNAHLNRIKINDTNLGELCAEVDTFDHFFIECQETIGLWQRLFDLFIPIKTTRS